MLKEEFNFPSSDGNTEIHSIRWIPEGEVRAILQLSHGMVEHIERYDDFAAFLTGKGFLVTGNDHLGHGKSVTDEKKLFHFPKNGNSILLKDMHRLRSITQKKYPDIPYFIMGHSMGSFLVRQYICMQGSGLKGAVIMGTGEQSRAALSFAKGLSNVKSAIQKPEHHSKTITKLAFGTYNSKIKDNKTEYDWLSRDEEMVNRYIIDPLCGGTFTNQAFSEMFGSMIYLKKKDNLKKMPEDLPLLFVSGDADPVGAYGKGPRVAAKRCLDSGVENVTCKIYEGSRHELLNEINKEDVYSDIAEWLISQL